MLTKQPDLFPHQRRALAGAVRYSARLIYRLPGTGKTRIGMELIKNQLRLASDSRILWVSPANLIAQLKDNFAQFGLDCYDLFPEEKVLLGRCAICSYDMLRLNQKFVCGQKWDMVVCDEFHKAKSSVAKTNHALWRLRRTALRWYGLTGTPFQNTPYEFFELVGLCLGRHIAPECEECLQYKYPKHTPVRNFLRRLGFRLHRVNQGPVVGIRFPERLGKILNFAVDYVAPARYLQECRLPKVVISTEAVPLTANEESIYKATLAAFSRKKRYRSFAADDMTDEQIERCFNGLSTLRTISLQESKPRAAIRLVSKIQAEVPAARIIIFCNFVEHGLNLLSRKFSSEGIRHILYNGEVSARKRAAYINDYLGGKKNVILLSPVGFEGLDLYGTTHIIILDPHYNPERSTQLMSRAIRAFSNVAELQIIKLHSVSQHIKPPLIDEVIEQIAQRKSKVSKLLEETLSQHSGE